MWQSTALVPYKTYFTKQDASGYKKGTHSQFDSYICSTANLEMFIIHECFC